MSILDPSTPPLKPAELFVLAALHAAPLHGYGLVQEVAARSQGRIRIRPGNLYRVLDRLLDRGLIDVHERASAGDERRTYYRITPLGRRTAQAEAKLLAEVIGELLAT
ncbi:MAG TPA: helix-turn-helix transcriptional regulator [Myxococcales bacterium]|nr:helix-turn-helix transcriptional regulator [Myxococcales bacterium]